MTDGVRLGVNIDHIATLRNARGGVRPDPVLAAQAALDAGASGITAHLREDRRHIRDGDIKRLAEEVQAPLNLEMAATDEMLAIALRLKPHACCIVPERRQEITTEGGLDAVALHNHLTPFVRLLGDAGIRVSLFIDPDAPQIEAAARLQAPVIELHTGTYCDAFVAGDGLSDARELERLAQAAQHAERLGIEVHAGHGLDYDTAPLVSAIPQIRELNIGHFLVGEAVFSGLGPAVAAMLAVIQEGVLRRNKRL